MDKGYGADVDRPGSAAAGRPGSQAIRGWARHFRAACQCENGEVTAPGEGSDHGLIVVARRTLLVDLMRRYLVFIDDAPVGQLWARQTGRYAVRPGRHTVRLCMQASTADSEEVAVEVTAGAVVRLRTLGKGLGTLLRVPGMMVQQAAAPGSELPHSPWIVLRLDQ